MSDENKKESFYGEWVFFEENDEHEQKMSLEYLALWKFFLKRKLELWVGNVTFEDQEIIYKPKIDSVLSATMGLKFKAIEYKQKEEKE